jgi:tripeptide aminopeptidase
LDAESGINAILHACRLGTTLPTGLLDSVTTGNIGIIAGGSSINVVPDLCTIEGELRSLEEERLAYWKEKITERVDKIELNCSSSPTASLTSSRNGLPSASIFWELAYPGYSLSTEEPHLIRFQQACRSLGISPRFLSSRGGGDANYLNAKGIRSFVFGLGMEGIHTPNERYRLSTLEQAASLLERMLLRE